MCANRISAVFNGYPPSPPNDITVYRLRHLVLSREMNTLFVEFCVTAKSQGQLRVADAVNSAKQRCNTTSDNETIHGSADYGLLLKTGMSIKIAL